MNRLFPNIKKQNRNLNIYRIQLEHAWMDNNITKKEKVMLKELRKSLSISSKKHQRLEEEIKKRHRETKWSKQKYYPVIFSDQHKNKMLCTVGIIDSSRINPSGLYLCKHHKRRTSIFSEVLPFYNIQLLIYEGYPLFLLRLSQGISDLGIFLIIKNQFTFFL